MFLQHNPNLGMLFFIIIIMIIITCLFVVIQLLLPAPLTRTDKFLYLLEKITNANHDNYYNSDSSTLESKVLAVFTYR